MKRSESPPYRISVVIPTYQRRASVQRALRALSRQTLQPEYYEVIVAIDGSTDGTREMVCSYPANYELKALEQQNSGAAAARNAGMQGASGDILVFLDDDMEPSPQFLRAHLDAHHDSARSAIVGAAPIGIDESSPPILRYIAAKFNSHLNELAQPSHVFTIRDFYSGNFSVRRRIILDVGGFDERFKTYGNEDVELALRFAKHDVLVMYEPRALAYQHHTKDFGAMTRDSMNKGRTSVILAMKHPQSIPDLRLSEYDRASVKWRVVRGALLSMTDIWPGAQSLVKRFIRVVERNGPPDLDPFYTLALDYFYWVGVFSMLKENRRRIDEMADGGIGTRIR